VPSGVIDTAFPKIGDFGIGYLREFEAIFNYSCICCLGGGRKSHVRVPLIRDAPDIRPDKPAFFAIRYPAGYQIALPDIRPDIR
jgi:hypothetical protein